jgi:very-short-patch-repair endonuclease
MNIKFRRQHVIRKYIVDFYCAEKKLIIEIDGGQHDERKAYDEGRSKVLKSMGYTVIRFWNNEVLAHEDGVKEKLFEILGGNIETLTLALSL